ncbi:MAG: antitoxin [Synechococcus sp.]
MRAKLFRNGRSQAVRLPASCRFEGTEVEVERDPQTGVVSLRPLRSTPLEWLRRRAALLNQESHSDDGFAVLTQCDDLSGPAQERDWP